MKFPIHGQRWQLGKQQCIEVLAQLSPREFQIVALCSEGYFNHEIGRILGIAQKTVEKHKANALAKVKLERTTHLNRLLFEAGEDYVRERYEQSGDFGPARTGKDPVSPDPTPH